MILSNYTKTRVNRLSKLKIEDVTEPINIKIQWIQSLSMERKKTVSGVKKHKHYCFEVHFIISGEIVYEDENGIIYILKEGEGIIFAPESPHKVIDASRDLIKITISFLPEKTSILYNGMASLKAYTFSITQGMIYAFDAILSETDRKSIFSSVLIKNYVFDIICGIARSADISEQQSSDRYMGDTVMIAFAKQYIEDNKNIFLTCKDVADQCHFNVKYLNRIFKKETGMTLLTFIHKSKTEEAERLLSETDLTLDKIGQMLGFANEYYFNSFFKRCNGIAPGIYRSINKKE